MSKEEIKSRLYLLFLALQFSKQHTPFFTVGERILINQERAQLLQLWSDPTIELRDFSEDLEYKISQIYHQIKLFKWHPEKEKDFNL